MSWLRNRAGVALPSAIFGVVVVGMITAGAWSVTELDLKATNNRVDAATALRLAHTAETHVIAVLRHRMPDTPFDSLLRGFDYTANTADDGLLDGYSALGDSLDVPAGGRVVAGVGTYFVRITDDPRETDGLPYTDSNRRLRITCRGVTVSGSSAEINVIVANYQLPALAVDGSLEISSAMNANSSGGCGGIHANGDIEGGGNATVYAPGEVTAIGSITPTVNGTKIPNHPPVDIPDMNPSDFCGASGYVHIGSTSSNYSSGTWKPGALTAGVYCVTGNVEFQSDFGSAGSPVTVTVIASGSIKVGGKKLYMKAAHPDGIVLMAGGDLDLQSDASFEGLIYAGGQCYISGKPTITGQFVCKNKQPHPGENLFDRFSGEYGMQISGDATFNFTCNSLLSSVYGVVAWYPTVGS